MMYLQTVLADLPTNYFRLGELTGSQARDEILNKYVGTINGGVTLNQTGAIPNYSDPAMLFDGSSGYIDLTSTVTQSGIISVECWFKLSNITFTGYPRPLANDNVGTNKLGIELGIDALGVGVFANFGFTSSYVDIGYSIQLTTTEWYYLAAVYNGATAYLYLNGNQVGTNTPSLTLAAGGYNFNIGRNPAYAGDYLPGLADEVAIYNGIALSSDQIANHYMAGINNQAESYTVCIDKVPMVGTFTIVEQGSLQVQSSIGRQGQASFVVETDSTIHFEQFEQVMIYDQFGALPFTGYLNTPQEETQGYYDGTEFHGLIKHTISCMDQAAYILTKRTVTTSFTDKTCGYVAQWILDNVLVDEGVVRGQIYDGLTPSTTLYPSPTLYPGGNVGIIPLVNFGYAKASDALNALASDASSSGVPYYCSLDQLKRLWFVPYTTLTSTMIVDGTKQQNIKVIRANPKYRNQQTVIGGAAQTSTQNKSFVGDGQTTTWTLDYALASTPTITVDSVAKTVGIKGVDTGKDFYWNEGSANVSQDSGGTVLTSSNTLAVTYVGTYPNTTISQNASQVSYQASIDGTSGINEDVRSDPTLTDVNSALASASADLTLNAQQGMQVTFDTMEYGYVPGEIMTVDLPWHNIHNEQMLIVSVIGGDASVDNFNIWYSVLAVVGPYDVSWQDFYSKQLANPAQANSINIGTAQSVNVLQQLTASISPSASLNINNYSCPLPSGSLVLPVTPC